MSALSKVWVVSEAPERFAALGAVGRRLGERVEAVAVGEGAAQAAASCGAEAVYTVAVPEGGLVEDCAAAIAGAAGSTLRAPCCSPRASARGSWRRAWLRSWARGC